MNEPLKLLLVVLGNHLWQSTLVAALLGGLTLLLRRNSARLRYWLWLAASLKFLVPFALLATLGTQIPWQPSATIEAAAPQMVAVAGDVAAPMAYGIAIPDRPDEGTVRKALSLWPLAVFSLVWAAGAIVVSLRWLSRWLVIRRALRNATPMTGMDFPSGVRSTTKQFEPGVVGVFRPALLLPAGIEQRLTPAQMSAVLAHERCHLRWRDNFTASLHMLVETLFWYFPLVWWIGARLIEERERDCDEQVIRDGHAPQSYGEAILAVCEHYVASRLPCVSGVSGSDLRKRIERIAARTLVLRLDRPKKLALAAVIGCTVTAPLAAGMITGSTWQVLFSLRPETAALAEYARLTTAAVMSSYNARSPGRPTASKCPAPSREADAKRRKALAATVAKLSPQDGRLVLQYAVAAGSTADVRRLLAGGAARGGGFRRSNTLMHEAAQFSDAQMLQVLADAGFGVEGNPLSADTPLMLAISMGRRDNIDWLIRHGADLDAENRLGDSALVVAMNTCRDQALVSQLIQAGAQPNAKARRMATVLGFDLTAPVAGANSQYQRAASLAEIVIGAHAAAHACPRLRALTGQQQALATAVAGLSASDGKKVLFFAVLANSTADVKRLVAEGAPQTGVGTPLLHTAAGFGEPAMLETLVRAGAKVNDLARDRSSALHAAALEGREDNIAWLIQHGADVNARNDQGKSVLTYASFCQDQQLINMLIAAGARPDVRDLMTATEAGMKLPADFTPIRADEVLRQRHTD